MKRVIAKTIIAGLIAAPTVLGAQSSISLSYRYKDAQSKVTTKEEKSVLIDTDNDHASDAILDKTLLVLDMGKAIQSALSDFNAVCQDPADLPNEGPWNFRLPIRPPFIEQDKEECLQAHVRVADSLLEKIASLSNVVQSNAMMMRDKKLFDTLDLMRQLSRNMKEQTISHPVVTPFPGHGGISRAELFGGSINVTTGGAQDFGFIRKLINDGLVPLQENFDIKGFLGEFDLEPQSNHCEQLICLDPVYKVDAASKKLFIQLGMNTNVTEATFQRKPLNLGLVIDISGSMSANDNTEKSRLEWAKEAAIKSVNELNLGDSLSIVVFDSDSEVVVPPVQIASEQIKHDVIEKIVALQTKGSTNLFAGLNSAYQLVSVHAAANPELEARIILISDAGLNTGITDDATTLRLVSDYAAEGIGLTAIGLGENFNQNFIMGITKAVGGNYVYVHSGQDMFRYFESFKFLVSPVAYQFKAVLDVSKVNARFVNAYGIPSANNDPIAELINVQTLFFTNQGGGAMLLEYDLD